jgi:hypothetical protein
LCDAFFVFLRQKGEKKMKKVLILTVLLLVFVLVGCNDKERNFDIPREEQFIVGLEANYQPFNWTEDFSSPFNHPINNFFW